jgi:hypothetical protein
MRAFKEARLKSCFRPREEKKGGRRAELSLQLREVEVEVEVLSFRV